MRGRVTLLLLALFVAADVVLVTLAFRHASAPAAGPDAVGAAASSSTPSAVDASPDPEPSVTTAGSSEGLDLTFLDVGSGGGPVLSATRGDCDSGRTPAVYVARGVTSAARERTPEDISEVLRVTAGSDGLTVVGRTQKCQVATWTSDDKGRSWSQEVGAPSIWYLAPSPTASAVFSPNGRRPTPCPPASLSTVGDDDVVRLSCADGRVLGTSDGGDTWVQLGRLEGATAIRFTSPGDGLALAAEKDCPAAVLRTSDGGTSWSRSACLGDGDPLAVAAEGDLALAQVGDVLKVSRDGGRTWPDLTG